MDILTPYYNENDISTTFYVKRWYFPWAMEISFLHTKGCGNATFQNKEIIVINSISKKGNPILNCGKHFLKQVYKEIVKTKMS